MPMTKIYTGYRNPPGGGCAVTVREEGKEPRPLDPGTDLRNHSATGFQWGYAGSGPAQLALALAAEVLGDDELAQDVYQRLQFRLVGRPPHDGWSLTEDRLRQAIRDIQDRDQGRSPGPPG
jgi:hypothetical protein